MDAHENYHKLAPEYQMALRALLNLGSELPAFLASQDMPTRFEAVGLLYALNPIPEEALLKLLLTPELVRFQLVVPGEGDTPGWYTGAEGVKLAKTRRVAGDQPNDGIMDALLGAGQAPAEGGDWKQVFPPPDAQGTTDRVDRLAADALRDQVHARDHGMIGNEDYLRRQMERLRQMAEAAEAMGVDPGPMLGTLGLDWPPGSGNYHGGTPPEGA